MKVSKQVVCLLSIVNLFSCSNFSIDSDECLHISEVNVVDDLILHDGKAFSGVLFETDRNANRLYHKIQSPIQIKGLPDEFKGKVGYAMTVVEGKISGPFVTMWEPYHGTTIFERLSEEEKRYYGRYYSYDMQDEHTAKGKLRIFENNGKLHCEIEEGQIESFRINAYEFGGYSDSFFRGRLLEDCTLSGDYGANGMDLNVLYTFDLLQAIINADKWN